MIEDRGKQAEFNSVVRESASKSQLVQITMIASEELLPFVIIWQIYFVGAVVYPGHFVADRSMRCSRNQIMKESFNVSKYCCLIHPNSHHAYVTANAPCNGSVSILIRGKRDVGAGNPECLEGERQKQRRQR